MQTGPPRPTTMLTFLKSQSLQAAPCLARQDTETIAAIYDQLNTFKDVSMKTSTQIYSIVSFLRLFYRYFVTFLISPKQNVCMVKTKELE